MSNRHDRVSAQTRNEQRMVRNAGRNLSSITDPIEKIRIISLKRGATGILALGRQFRIMDKNGNRELSFEEFRTGLHEIGCEEITDEECQQVFKMFDQDNSGNINYEEFLRAIRPPMNQMRVALVDKAFAKLDTSGDGVVTVEDMRSVYNVKCHSDYLNGDKDEKQFLKEFLKKFENGTPDGRLTKEEFLDYYSGVSASVDDDMHFDLFMRQAWKL